MTPLGFPGTRPDGTYYPWLVMLEEPPGIVLLKTAFGGTRIVDLLVGDPLPRIC